MMNWKGKLKGRDSVGVGLEPVDAVTLLTGKPLVLYADHTKLPFDIVLHFGSSRNELLKHMIDAGLNPFEGMANAATQAAVTSEAVKAAESPRQTAGKRPKGKAKRA